jgi:hypothetical protein
MRLPIIPPANLNSEQKPLYDDMREGIARIFKVLSISVTTARCSDRGIRGFTNRNSASRCGN